MPPDRAGQRGKLAQVGADLVGVGVIVGDGVARLERRIGNARQKATEIGRRLLFLEQAPKRGVSGSDEQQNGNDGAHRN